MDCLRPLRARADTPGGQSRGRAGDVPLSFGFDPASWHSAGDHLRDPTRRHDRVDESRNAILDAITLNPRHLYELSGEASAGKTQLSLQLVVRAVLSGGGGGSAAAGDDTASLCRAVYLFTEGGTLKMDRLRQIASSRLGDEALTDAVMRHVHVEYATSVDGVISTLLMLEDVLRAGGDAGEERYIGDRSNDNAPPPVRLLVLDSIAHVFRFRDHGDTKYDSYDASRSQAFFKIASILKRYADEYNIAVLVTNQVVDAIDDGGGATGESDRPGCAGLTLETSGRKVYPALGLAWASCVTTRLFVTKETAMCEETRGARSVVVEGAGGAVAKQLRGLQVVFSPEMKQVKTHFVVETAGCVGVDVAGAGVALGLGGGVVAVAKGQCSS
jgi:DNA-repair protein XRCC3